MRRTLFLFMLFVLPLQFAWAAATAYCGLESSHGRADQVAHFGHHEHRHLSHTSAESQAKSGGIVVDTDCGTCQLGAAQPIPGAKLSFESPGVSQRFLRYDKLYGSHISGFPERLDKSTRLTAVRLVGVTGADVQEVALKT